MTHVSAACSTSASRPRCRSGAHIWQATFTVGQLLCLRCGLLACCPLCQQVLPTPDLVLVHCTRHRLQAQQQSTSVAHSQREVQP